MRTSALAVAGLILLASTSAAFGAFAGAYAPENWTFYSDGGSSAGYGALTETAMTVTGIDGDPGYLDGLAYYVLTITKNDTVSFHYDFTTEDIHPDDWADRAFYMLNGNVTYLTWWPASGDASVVVTLGDEFALGVWSEDGLWGAGELLVTSFVPEPGGLALLAVGALAALRRRR